MPQSANSLLGALAQINIQGIETATIPPDCWESDLLGDAPLAPGDFFRGISAPIMEIHARQGGDHETIGQLFYLLKLPTDTLVRLNEQLWVAMDEEMVSGSVMTGEGVRQLTGGQPGA